MCRRRFRSCCARKEGEARRTVVFVCSYDRKRIAVDVIFAILPFVSVSVIVNGIRSTQLDQTVPTRALMPEDITTWHKQVNFPPLPKRNSLKLVPNHES